ncbi:MAG: AAA family ATPase [Armatimonadetes bacterium]|nr:AAA family ATPase [Armatimonadota bacterium]
MRISSIKLKNFKRFSDLEISDIPESAKLVVVVGPNGCGKSSLFDALIHWYHRSVGFGYNQDLAYYQKSQATAFDWNQSVSVTLHGDAQPHKGMLNIRTAYRNDPDFSVDGINRPDDPSERPRIQRSIENDQTVSDNYRRLIYDTMSGVYSEENNNKTIQELRGELIGGIRESMQRVFEDLILNNISDPLGAGAFYFKKGEVQSFHYKNLSGGEKAAFDLILDLHIKKRYFSNTVYCVDELDTHLHTRIQGKLLKEMVNILPDECQLWVTTHSLGVLRAAQEMIVANPDSVTLIDFEGVDLDVPRKLLPSNLDRVAWEKFLSITLDDLSQRIAPRVVIVCEGSTVGTRRKDYDAEIYNRILGARHAETIFVSGGSADQVLANAVSVREALGRILPNSRFVALADRDDKSPAQVIEFENAGGFVLGQRNLESYLFADDVIEALVKDVGKEDKLAEALQIKRDKLAASTARGNSADDLKSASGDIYVELKRLLDLQRCGNDKDAFMRDTLAPLIAPPMTTYSDLEAAIITRL